MSVIIRLQGLPWTASSLDIRNFFNGLSIPPGGVHIIGGTKGEAFIAFSTDEDARKAMMFNFMTLNGCVMQLFLSSKSEMQTVIEQAKSTPDSSDNYQKPQQNNQPSTRGPVDQPPYGGREESKYQQGNYGDFNRNEYGNANQMSEKYTPSRRYGDHSVDESYGRGTNLNDNRQNYDNHGNANQHQFQRGNYDNQRSFPNREDFGQDVRGDAQAYPGNQPYNQPVDNRNPKKTNEQPTRVFPPGDPTNQNPMFNQATRVYPDDGNAPPHNNPNANFYNNEREDFSKDQSSRPDRSGKPDSNRRYDDRDRSSRDKDRERERDRDRDRGRDRSRNSRSDRSDRDRDRSDRGRGGERSEREKSSRSSRDRSDVRRSREKDHTDPKDSKSSHSSSSLSGSTNIASARQENRNMPFQSEGFGSPGLGPNNANKSSFQDDGYSNQFPNRNFNNAPMGMKEMPQDRRGPNYQANSKMMDTDPDYRQNQASNPDGSGHMKFEDSPWKRMPTDADFRNQQEDFDSRGRTLREADNSRPPRRAPLLEPGPGGNSKGLLGDAPPGHSNPMGQDVNVIPGRDHQGFEPNNPNRSGPLINRDGPPFNRDGPPVNRDDHHFPRDGPPYNRDGPPFNRDGPPFNRDGPPFNRDGPPFNRDGPPFNRDVPPINRDGPPINRDGPPFNRDGPPINRDGPPFNRDGPPFNRDEPPFNRDGPPFNRDESPFKRDGPPFSRDEPPYNREGPPFNREGPPFNRDGQPFNRDGPPFNRDGPPFNRDGPPFNRDGPPFNRGGPPFNREDPPFRRDGPPFGRDGPPFGRDGPPFRRDGPPFGRDGPPFNRDAPPFGRDNREGPPFNRDGPPFNREGTANNREGRHPIRDEPPFNRDGPLLNIDGSRITRDPPHSRDSPGFGRHGFDRSGPDFHGDDRTFDRHRHGHEPPLRMPPNKDGRGLMGVAPSPDIRDLDHRADRGHFGDPRARPDDHGNAPFDEDERQIMERTVYAQVKNLPYSATKGDIRKFYGNSQIEFDGIRFLSDESGSRTGICFIQFKTERDLEEALMNFGHLMDNRKIIIMKCAKSEYDAATRGGDTGAPVAKRPRQDAVESSSVNPNQARWLVYLKGLHRSSTKEDIWKFLGNSRIADNGKAIFFDIDQFGNHVGLAFVELETNRDMQNALQMDGNMISSRIIEVGKSHPSELDAMLQAHRRMKEKTRITVSRPNDDRNGKQNNSSTADQKSDKAKGESDKFSCVSFKGLSPSTTGKDIIEFFRGIKIPDGNIRFANEVGTGLIQFFSVDDCKNAMKKNGEKLKNSVIKLETISKTSYDEKASKIKKSETPSKDSTDGVQNTSNKNLPAGILRQHWFYLRCKNFPETVTIGEMLKFFNGYDPIPESIRLHYSSDGKPTGNAVIGFPTKDMSEKAFNALNGEMCRNNKVEIFLA